MTGQARKPGAAERLLEGMHAWTCGGTAQDQLITLTEGVIPHEERGPRIELGKAALKVSRPGPHRLLVEIEGSWGDGGRYPTPKPQGPPGGSGSAPGDTALRAGVSWDLVPSERLTGLGARHGLDFDQRGRCVHLGADRRYTGPDCPEEFLENTKLELFQDQVYVFSPKGDLIELPSGATPTDATAATTVPSTLERPAQGTTNARVQRHRRHLADGMRRPPPLGAGTKARRAS